MSAGFLPTRTLLTPADPPDYLSNAVLQSLTRPPLERYTWGAFGTFFFGALSFGILPLLFPLRRQRQFHLIERDQYFHLSEWMRLQCGDNASDLPESHDEINRNAGVPFIVGIASAFVTMWIVLTHIIHSGWSFGDLLRLAYGTPWTILVNVGRSGDIWLDRLVPTMLIGQIAYWFNGLLQSRSTRRFAERFNLLAKKEGFAPVSVPALSFGLRPLWMVGALIFISLHAPWGAVMMLAGASQRRYIRHESMNLRLQLAQRVRDVMAVKRPLTRVPVSTSLREKCNDEKCRSPLPATARFCPRCGKRVAEKVDRVA